MKPSRFIPYQQRRLGRLLTLAEKVAVETARVDCRAGNRQTVKAMWLAMDGATATRLDDLVDEAWSRAAHKMSPAAA